GRTRDANLRVGGDELLFGLLDVGPPRDQRRRQPCRQFRRVRLLDERQAARDRCGIAAGEEADEVLLLRDLALERRDFCGRAVDELLGLTHVDEGGGAALLANLRQPQRLLTRRERPPRDLELGVERAQGEVRVGHLADERRHDGAAAPLAGEERRARRFGRAAVASPEVELPRQRSLHDAGGDVARRKAERGGRTLAEDVDAGADLRKL